jgi:gentisate 1,2-dioxygenase
MRRKMRNEGSNEDSPMTGICALANAADLDDLRRQLDPLDFMAGWNKHEPSLWKEPRTDFKPALWRWAAAKAGLDAAGRLIDAEQAERRNLFMVNPIEGNHYATLRTLVSAYQMLLPGEKARTHRHSPNALRLVLDVQVKPGNETAGAHGHQGGAKEDAMSAVIAYQPITERVQS